MRLPAGGCKARGVDTSAPHEQGRTDAQRIATRYLKDVRHGNRWQCKGLVLLHSPGRDMTFRPRTAPVAARDGWRV
ncbi:hypothetical protein GCM10023320_77970 [Pseudonocardia adelaidensis]|uniref:Uncharacterized protein n=1 Tax=Pseudonocardia adelaidensis TaxID=648754 RepID=A0ABP9P4B8_9PSEU